MKRDFRHFSMNMDARYAEALKEEALATGMTRSQIVHEALAVRLAVRIVGVRPALGIPNGTWYNENEFAARFPALKVRIVDDAEQEYNVVLGPGGDYDFVSATAQPKGTGCVVEVVYTFETDVENSYVAKACMNADGSIASFGSHVE
jgi:hypothetical protein